MSAGQVDDDGYGSEDDNGEVIVKFSGTVGSSADGLGAHRPILPPRLAPSDEHRRIVTPRRHAHKRGIFARMSACRC
jgi:hypothetical protein